MEGLSSEEKSELFRIVCMSDARKLIRKGYSADLIAECTRLDTDIVRSIKSSQIPKIPKDDEAKQKYAQMVTLNNCLNFLRKGISPKVVSKAYGLHMNAVQDLINLFNRSFAYRLRYYWRRLLVAVTKGNRMYWYLARF